MRAMNRTRCLSLTMILWLMALIALAQETTLVQIKTLNKNLKPIPNLELSLDKIIYFKTKRNGVLFRELNENLLPPKVIYIANESLEAESWNYSNGVLEIVIRKKVFDIYKVTLIDTKGIKVAGVKVTLNLDKPIEAISNRNGEVDLSIPIHFKRDISKLFNIRGYEIIEANIIRKTGLITIKHIPVQAIEIETDIEESSTIPYLDTIQNLPMFYAYLRSINMANMPYENKEVIDSKFNLLMDSIVSFEIIKDVEDQISDSSLVSNDIVFLTESALRESKLINETRKEFNKQVAVINDKIIEGGGNLNEKERENLLKNLEILDDLLLENEILFAQNQSYYKLAISELKNKLLNIQELEDKLSASELQRLAEQKVFKKQLIIALAIVIGLLILATFFIYLARRFNKQKKALFIANEKVKTVNENLETLVADKTSSLQKVNEELETFLYRSAHDLKGPLASIIGLADIAKLSMNEEAYELFLMTKKTAYNMNRLLEKLQVISQINHPEDFSEIDFSEMVEKLILSSKEFIDTNKISFSYTIAENVKFSTYPAPLESVLNNIIDNAFLYSLANRDKKPTVEINVSQEKSTLTISIKDNGEGISDTIEHKIWDMFYRGNIKATGNGLGLYIAKRAVKALNGEISYTTTLGKGTEFIVQFPC